MNVNGERNARRNFTAWENVLRNFFVYHLSNICFIKILNSLIGPMPFYLTFIKCLLHLARSFPLNFLQNLLQNFLRIFLRIFWGKVSEENVSEEERIFFLRKYFSSEIFSSENHSEKRCNVWEPYCRKVECLLLNVLHTCICSAYKHW